jgi:GMP synthase-like glutamine amidotransferase
MRVHVLQHVPFEGLGSIAHWLDSRGAEVTSTALYADPRMPAVDDFDWLIVMGGPMGANDDDRHAWLAAERDLIAAAVADAKIVLGICLGAQLLARALGARVFPNGEREIGWFRVEPVDAPPTGTGDSFESPLPRPIEAFHWHGDTFDLPPGATHLARSAGCAHQAFSVGRRVLGLQFHLETTAAGARAMIDHCPDDLRPGRWVQSEREILCDPTRFERTNDAMRDVLAWLARGGV